MSFHGFKTTAFLAAACGLLTAVPEAIAQSSDNSVGYSSPSQNTSTPSQPNTQSPPPVQPQPSGSGYTRGRSISYYSGGRYYSFGVGDPSIYIGPGNSYFGRAYGRYYWPRDYRYFRRYDSPDSSTLIELARRYDPQLIGADPNAEPPTARELGVQALQAGQYEAAIAQFAEAAAEERRDTEGDEAIRQAQRLLGIAYAAAKRFDEAGTQLTAAFEADPSLRTIPIRGEDLFPDGLELSSIVSRAVGHAHSNPSYDSWFTVAVLMQAQGRNDLANTMIKRGEDARAANASKPAGEATPDTESPEAKPEPEQRKPSGDSEADRLRRELERSTERLLETQRRLEELKRKQAESDGG